MNVVVVHDYLTQMGGAERVVLEIAKAFDASRVVTSVYAPDRTYPGFRDLEVTTLGLEGIPLVREDPRLAMPVLGDLYKRHHIEDADLVVVSSSGFAHMVSTDAPKVVYCHNPPRWLHQPEDYLGDAGLAARTAVKLFGPRLRKQDRAGAASATGYIANSRNVAARIDRVYGRQATVVHPPRGLEPDGPVEQIVGLPENFLLTVGRARGYKRTGLLMEAVAAMPDLTLVVVGGQSEEEWPGNIVQLSRVPDAQLRWLYRSAGALLAASHEDFGLTPVEAFSAGTPVGAIQAGGYLETCVEGLTGLWLDDSSPEALRASIRELVSRPWDRAAIRQHGQRWSPESFRRQLVDTVLGMAGGERRSPLSAA